MSVPDWWEALLLGAAAWRSFQLLAFDDILEWPRRYITRLGKDWEEGQDWPKGYRLKLTLFINCPYCAGFWVALAWWGAWQAWDDSTLVVATPFVLSALVVAGHKLLASD